MGITAFPQRRYTGADKGTVDDHGRGGMTDEQLGDEWDRIHEARIDRELEDKNMEGEKDE